MIQSIKTGICSKATHNCIDKAYPLQKYFLYCCYYCLYFPLLLSTWWSRLGGLWCRRRTPRPVTLAQASVQKDTLWFFTEMGESPWLWGFFARPMHLNKSVEVPEDFHFHWTALGCCCGPASLASLGLGHLWAILSPCESAGRREAWRCLVHGAPLCPRVCPTLSGYQATTLENQELHLMELSSASRAWKSPLFLLSFSTTALSFKIISYS